MLEGRRHADHVIHKEVKVLFADLIDLGLCVGLGDISGNKLMAFFGNVPIWIREFVILRLSEAAVHHLNNR
jgi:hypothetical protein